MVHRLRRPLRGVVTLDPAVLQNPHKRKMHETLIANVDKNKLFGLSGERVEIASTTSENGRTAGIIELVDASACVVTVYDIEKKEMVEVCTWDIISFGSLQPK